jgi:hypothetical protein
VYDCQGKINEQKPLAIDIQGLLFLLKLLLQYR